MEIQNHITYLLIYLLQFYYGEAYYLITLLQFIEPQMLIYSFIFIVLLIIQVLFALNALISRSGLQKKYNLPLVEQVDAAKALENYVKIFRKVNLSVDSHIGELPAKALRNFILINKKKMYLFDLFTDYYLIFQLELTKPRNDFIRNISFYQQVVFLTQIIFFITGIALSSSYKNADLFIIFAIGFQILSFGFGFIGYLMMDSVLKSTHFIARDLLSFDELEETKASELQSELKLKVYEYPLTFFQNIWKFIKPF